MRILAVSDSDSYLKWSHALLRQTHGHATHEVVLGNVLAPSPTQVRAATGQDIERVSMAGFLARVRRLRPDVILVACTGPALETVVNALHAAGELAARAPGRPVLVSGFPGVTVPANELALRFRRHVDVVVVHSRNEVDQHRRLAASLGMSQRFALATLPFLDATPARGGRDVVFAAQSLVPAEVDQRRRILHTLAQVPASLRPVVKVRAVAGERQAHNERWPYAQLDPDPRIEFRAGSMIDALAEAAGFVTVSSTAALEAIAAGVPSVVLGDFGVNESMINTVFEGSGLIGSLADVEQGRFRTPDPAWLADNYFHDRSEDAWLADVAELVARPRPPVHIEPFGSRTTRARRWLRLLGQPELARRLRAPRARRHGG